MYMSIIIKTRPHTEPWITLKLHQTKKRYSLTCGSDQTYRVWGRTLRLPDAMKDEACVATGLDEVESTRSEKTYRSRSAGCSSIWVMYLDKDYEIQLRERWGTCSVCAWKTKQKSHYVSRYFLSSFWQFDWLACSYQYHQYTDHARPWILISPKS